MTPLEMHQNVSMTMFDLGVTNCTEEIFSVDLTVSILSLQCIKRNPVSGRCVGSNVSFLIGNLVTHWTLKLALVPFGAELRGVDTD